MPSDHVDPQLNSDDDSAPRGRAAKGKFPGKKKGPGKGKVPRGPKRRVGELALKVAERSAKTAANSLLAVAILLTLGAGVMLTQRGGSSGLSGVLLMIQAGLAAVFWVLYSAARKAPERAYMPAILGALIYTPLMALQFVSNPGMLFSPSLVLVVLVIGGLFTGIRASIRYRDYLRKMEPDA